MPPWTSSWRWHAAEPARFLVLGTYRPPDALQRGHPFQTVTHELHMHGQCAELPLTLLSEAAVADYLAATASRRPNSWPGWRGWCISARRAIRCSWSVWWRAWCIRAG